GTATAYADMSSGFPDGLAFDPGGTLYAAVQSAVVSVTGTNTAHPGTTALVANLFGGPDGIALQSNPADPANPFVYVNENNGTLVKVDSSVSPPAINNVFTGGSRGDFATVGPDGCLYAT